MLERIDEVVELVPDFKEYLNNIISMLIRRDRYFDKDEYVRLFVGRDLLGTCWDISFSILDIDSQGNKYCYHASGMMPRHVQCKTDIYQENKIIKNETYIDIEPGVQDERHHFIDYYIYLPYRTLMSILHSEISLTLPHFGRIFIDNNTQQIFITIMCLVKNGLSLFSILPPELLYIIFSFIFDFN